MADIANRSGNGASPTGGGTATLSSPVQALTEAQGTLDGLIDQCNGFYAKGRDQPDWGQFLTGLKMVREQIATAMQNWSAAGGGST